MCLIVVLCLTHMWPDGMAEFVAQHVLGRDNGAIAVAPIFFYFLFFFKDSKLLNPFD